LQIQIFNGRHGGSLRDADFEYMLGQSDIGRPFAEAFARRHVQYRHGLVPSHCSYAIDMP